MGPGLFVFLVIVIFILVVIIRCIRIVPQACVFVVERLGAFHTAWQTGLHVIIPFIDKVAKKVSIKEQEVTEKDMEAQSKNEEISDMYNQVRYGGLCPNSDFLKKMKKL